jgi:uncharacterized protein (TIGR02145 family)
MKKKQSAMYGLLILVITLITSLSSIRTEGAALPADIDGHTYFFVTIGKQVWMRDNLNVSHYRNGDPIRHARTSEEWLDASAKGQGAWCYYKNDPANEKKYGRLYNWYAVNDPRGLAPTGWHLPTNEDWKNVATVLAGASATEEIKSSATSIWRYPALAVDNTIHFHAEAGGLREAGDTFRFIGENAFLWSSSEHSPALAGNVQFSFQNSIINLTSQDKKTGAAVRCIKD